VRRADNLLPLYLRSYLNTTIAELTGLRPAAVIPVSTGCGVTDSNSARSAASAAWRRQCDRPERSNA